VRIAIDDNRGEHQKDNQKFDGREPAIIGLTRDQPIDEGWSKCLHPSVVRLADGQPSR
jgi:hypothetical protein